MPIVEREASSLSQYLSICAELVQAWSSPETGESRLWYRGQKKAEWSLIPGEYRYPLINPDEMRCEFMLRAKPHLQKDPGTDWEWYFLMQHYGLATRLLDWAEGSLIGLYFAVSEDTGAGDSAVWALDPWALNEWSRKGADLVITGADFEPDPAAAKYLGPVYRRLRLPRRPIAVVPPYNSPRITAQRGTFTIHGSRKEGLDKQFSKRLAKIVVARERGLQIRRDLRSVGISEFTLFPDLDGLCRDIRAVEVEGC